MRAFSILIFWVLFLNESYGQNLLVSHYDSRGSVSASRYFPSTLELGEYSWQIGSNYSIWVANQSLDYDLLHRIGRSNELTAEDINNIISSLKPINILAAGQESMVLGLAKRWKTNKHQLTTSISVIDRMGATLTYPKQLIQLVWQGNKAFAGDTLHLGSLSVNARYLREYGIGIAQNLIERPKLSIRYGLRVKYLHALAGIYMPNNELDFYTNSDGTHIYLKYQSEAYLHGHSPLSLWKERGNGWAINLGLSIQWRKRLTLDVAANDIGQLKFNSQAQKFSVDNQFTFSGIDKDQINDIQQLSDSLQQHFSQYQSSKQAFRMPLGQRYMLQLSYKIKDTEDTRNTSMAFLTLVKGNANLPTVSKNLLIQIGYQQRLFKFLDVSGSVAYGGFNNFHSGALLGFRFSQFVRLNIFSDNMSGLIVKKWGTGADIGLNLAIYIR